MNQKTKTTGKNETAGQTAKKDRVILALSTGQAKMLSATMQNIAENYKENCEEKELAQKISQRIRKTLNNQEAKRLGYPRGTKQMQEESKRDKEEKVFLTDEDRAMQVNTEIRPEPGIISDRRY